MTSQVTPARVPFVDLAPQWRLIEEGVRPELTRLFESSSYCLGPWVDGFETEIAAYLGVPHAIGVNSGTSALHLAVLAAGIGPGDEVLVPAQTFIATVWGVLYAGARPVLCDVDSMTACIDLAEAERRVTPRTKAIIPVHLFGQPADMAAVLAFAKRHNLAVIEDCAQAIAARFDGKRVGSIGLMGCYSFYPGKNLGCAGEGGLVITHDATIAARLRRLRNHGQSERYRQDEVGYNYRMEGIQGLILSHKLRHIDAWTARRKEIAARYAEGLAGLPLGIPAATNGDHVYHLYVVLTEKRDALRAHLEDKAIDTGLHYPIPLNRQPCLAKYVGPDDRYPNADRFADHGLSLPMFYGLEDSQVDRVIAEMHVFFS